MLLRVQIWSSSSCQTVDCVSTTSCGDRDIGFYQIRTQSFTQYYQEENYSYAELGFKSVPESGTMLLFGTGLVGIGIRTRRKKTV